MRALVPTILLLAVPAPAASQVAPPSAAPAADAAAPPATVVPSAAVIEKLGHGDRLFLAADYRNALFAYQDAVYLLPRYAPARVKLGRAYLALRYPAHAVAQAEAALAADPDSADARKLLHDARNAPTRPPATADGASAAAVAAGAPAASPVPPRPGSRIFRLTPEPAAEPTAATTPTPAATPAPLAAAPADPSAADHYRAGVAQLGKREWAKAASELSSAIAADPNLAVAYVARGSARFGLGNYAEAAEDYRAALQRDPKLAMPLYGLAECHRALGDVKGAAEMYERYAESSATDVRDDLRLTAARRAKELQ